MSTKRFVLSLVFVSVLFLCCKAEDIIPDAKVQADIDKVILRLVDTKTKEDALSTIRQFEKGYTNRVFMLQQVLLYMATGGACTEERGYAAIGLVNFLVVDKQDKIKAALPMLGREEGDFHKMATGVLHMVDEDRTQSDGAVDFSPYEVFISESTSPPLVLIDYMYEREPDVALSSIAAVYLDKDEARSLVSQLKSEDDAQAVDRMSQRPEWWAKLYAAEKMKQNPKLRDPEIIEQLKQSKHAVVRETVQEIKDEKK